MTNEKLRLDKKYSKQELETGIKALQSTLNKCEKVLEKIPNHTLTIRRVEALKIAIDLMTEKINEA